MARKLLSSPSVTKKDSMWLVSTIIIPKQESVSLATRKTNATHATLELDLVLEVFTITPTRVAMKLHTRQIMVTSILRPWDIYWSNRREPCQACIVTEKKLQILGSLRTGKSLLLFPVC